MDETIFALASGAGIAGVAVMRVSGAAAGQAIEALSGQAPPPPRRASMRRLSESAGGTAIDEALVLWFPAPGSYTGEDVAEFHVHGGAAVIDAMLAALGGLPGCRLAQPGEFTRRAFENGKLDLTSAEAVADLVAAQTVAQRLLALEQYDGALASLYEGWRRRLIELQALAEALIDFSDEELPEDLTQEIGGKILGIQREISLYLDDQHRGERIRAGFRIAIVGAPNVGKSSLLNRLAARDAAIVMETAGTTRDVIEVHMQLGGYPVVLADTAGIRDTAETVEAEGVRRARRWAGEADLRLVVFDASRLPALDQDSVDYVQNDTIVVLNKVDVAGCSPPDAVEGAIVSTVSATMGDGIEELLERITREVAERLAVGEQAPLTRARHRQALEDCVAALGRATGASLPELVAEDLRMAARALGRITGRVDVEEVLDVIFRDFCIGK